ncbi:hypothetical protein AAMO2058_000022800 [Amorphochlora amoebiformis]
MLHIEEEGGEREIAPLLGMGATQLDGEERPFENFLVEKVLKRSDRAAGKSKPLHCPTSEHTQASEANNESPQLEGRMKFLQAQATDRYHLLALWFTMGLTNAFPAVGLRFYMIHDLKASPYVQALIGVLTGVAWNLKIVVAFVSDCLPIGGYHRKPYLVLGVVVNCVGYAIISNTNPGVRYAAMLLVLSATGQMITAVMCDTLVVENTTRETTQQNGSLLTWCWIVSTVGGLVGNLSGGLLLQYSFLSYKQALMLSALLKMSILPIANLIQERGSQGLKGSTTPTMHKTTHIKPTHKITPNSVNDGAQSVTPDERWREGRRQRQGLVWEEEGWGAQLCFSCLGECQHAFKRARTLLKVIWRFLKERDVWKATVFIYLFRELSYIMIVASLSGAGGMYLYSRYFSKQNWQCFFACVIIFSSAISLLQLVLVFRLNLRLGIPDIVFALGEDAIIDATNSVLSMPILILIANICPQGVESSVYALVTSIQIGGSTVGASISALLITAFGISLDNYSRLWQLIVVCSLAKVLVLPILPMLPRNQAKASMTRLSVSSVENDGGSNGDDEKRGKIFSQSSVLGAGLVIFLLAFGIMWSLYLAVSSLASVANA